MDARDIKERVREFIIKHGLFKDAENIIVGFSGGADSVCLLFMLRELQKDDPHLTYNLHAVHINHGIRKDEAERDERFVIDFCKRYDIELTVRHIDVPTHAAALGESLEAAGRRKRYEIFHEIGFELGNFIIATAHHKNDSAETVLLNIARGTGIAGLAGIRPERDNIIRPLLCLTREQIEKYNELKCLEHVEDSTNADNTYKRNCVRNKLMPIFEEEINSQIVEHIVRLSDIAARTESYLKKQASQLMESCEKKEYGIFLPTSVLDETDPVVRERLYVMLYTSVRGDMTDLGYERIEAIERFQKTKSRGGYIELPHGVCVIRECDGITFSDTKKMVLYHKGKRDEGEKKEIWLLRADVRDRLENGEEVRHTGGEYSVVLRLAENFMKNENGDYTKFFDYDKIGDNVCLRGYRPTDFITISKSGAKKSLKKELKDRKVAKNDRYRVPVIADGDECLWAVGVRRGESCMIDTRGGQFLSNHYGGKKGQRILQITILRR